VNRFLWWKCLDCLNWKRWFFGVQSVDTSYLFGRASVFVTPCWMGLKWPKDSKTQKQISTKNCAWIWWQFVFGWEFRWRHSSFGKTNLWTWNLQFTKTVWSILHSYQLRFQLEGGPIFHTHLPICGATFHKPSRLSTVKRNPQGAVQPIMSWMICDWTP